MGTAYSEVTCPRGTGCSGVKCPRTSYSGVNGPGGHFAPRTVSSVTELYYMQYTQEKIRSIVPYSVMFPIKVAL